MVGTWCSGVEPANLVVFDLEGNRLWIVDLPLKDGGDSISSPLLVDGRVIVNDDGLKAFDLKDGRLLWKTEWSIVKLGSSPDWGNPGTPAVMRHPKGAVVIGLAGAVVNATDGTILTPACKTEEVFNQKTLVRYLINSKEGQSPVAIGELLYGMDHERGRPVFCSGRVVVDEKGWRLEKIWKTINAAASRTHASPLIVEGVLYSANQGSNLTAIDVSSGNLVTNQLILHPQANWASEVPENMRKCMPKGVCMTWGEVWCASYAAGRLYFGTSLGCLAIVDPRQPDRATIRWFGNACLAAGPVFVGDRMYVRTDKELFCIAPKSNP
jgi:outer membrane protein assembly factor BamB